MSPGKHRSSYLLPWPLKLPLKQYLYMNRTYIFASDFHSVKQSHISTDRSPLFSPFLLFFLSIQLHYQKFCVFFLMLHDNSGKSEVLKKAANTVILAWSMEFKWPQRHLNALDGSLLIIRHSYGLAWLMCKKSIITLINKHKQYFWVMYCNIS